MSNIKTTFNLEENSAYKDYKAIINIIGQQPDNPPYVSITIQQDGNTEYSGWIADKDIERFAVNILKALKSKKLK